MKWNKAHFYRNPIPKNWQKEGKKLSKTLPKVGQKLAKGMAWFTKDPTTLKPPSYSKLNETKHIFIGILVPNVDQK